MDLNQLHFAHSLWLFAGLAIPLVWTIFFLFDRKTQSFHQLEKFIDKHLVPYLLINIPNKKTSPWKTLVIWSIVWSCLTISLAGPRWSFREMETFSRDQSLVILLDLSESMNATDVKPSRLIRAKQKIEDILNLSQSVKIGLVAFAADAHMITPITDDKETIRHLLPSLATDLVYVQGSRLSPALTMASKLLESEPGTNKAILVISDGGFEDASAIITAKKIAETDIAIHVMGVGTIQGAPLHKNKTPILSKLEKDRLNEISKVGHGRYLEVHYSNDEESIILNDLEKNADAQMNVGKKNQFWDEHFYLFILPIIPFMLWWFRRGYIFAAFLILCSPSVNLEAFEYSYFKNSEELGKEALEAGDYDSASNFFQDPYRKGVAYYNAKNYPEAEKMFRESSRDEISSCASYNLGNALAQQQKFKEAIEAYEKVLKDCPDHSKAKENLEIVKKLLDQQKNEDSKSGNDKDKEKKQDEDKSQNNDKNKNNPSDSEEQDSDNQNEDQESNESQDSQDAQNNKDQQEDSDDNQSSQQEEQSNEEQSNEEQGQQQEDNEPINESQKEQQEADQQDTQETETQMGKSQEDQDADLWLNRITNDPKSFLKNKFYIESKKNGTKEGIDPW